MATRNAWFAVQGLDGTEAYTRNGSLEIAPDGTLMTSNGLACCPMAAPRSPCRPTRTQHRQRRHAERRVPGQPANQIGRLKMVTPTPDDPLKRSDDGLFRTATADPLPNDAQARLQSGCAGGLQREPDRDHGRHDPDRTPVRAADAMIQTAESNDRQAGQLLSMQG
jgi:flagellar basal-body rod protein FlgF